MLTSSATVCIIGFGESGRAAGAALTQRGHAVRAWDTLLADPARSQMMHTRMAEALVGPATSLADAMSGAKVIVCAVDAASAAVVKRTVNTMLVPGQVLLDVEALDLAYDPDMRQVSLRGELP